MSATHYPVSPVWNGILLDDADHSHDIVKRLRGVFEIIWKDRSEIIEREACEVLGVNGLRDYFRKTGKGSLWDDHLSRYSTSHRKAPIYWLLQSSQKNYALWLYYHRLDKDLLFKALVPWIGGRPIAEVIAPELLAVVRRIENRGALETAHRALGNCGQVFRYAVATGRAMRDPSGGPARRIAPGEG